MAEQSTSSNVPNNHALTPRGQEIFHANQLAVYKRTDRMFAYLMLVQWVMSVLVALWISPRTWAGTISDVHVHVWAALFLGGLITAFPVALAFFEPGRAITRHAIGVGQILMSCLLIHLTGGRIETHFHVFCSLAFLSLYRDWRVLILPTIIVGVDHFVRGLIWPQSVYGINVVQPYRWLEHVGWVLFEDAVLIFSSIKAAQALQVDANNKARLEQTKELVEAAVVERTAELKEARDQALAASRSKSQFVANMSHEVRTPMSGILGLTEILLAEEEDSGKKQQLKMIFSSAQALLAVLNDILDYSKLEAGKLSIQPVSFSPAMLVEEVTHFMVPKAIDKGLSLRTSCSDDLPRLACGDQGRIRQVLINLLSNAIKFTESGSVTAGASLLGVEGNQASVRFQVSDTGLGLEETSAEKLFQPFEQLDSSSSRSYGGTGLGLAISKHLVELMGGTMGLESQPGKGSTFCFNVPLTLDASPSAAPAVPGETPVNLSEALERLSRKTILVVEDSEVMVKIIKAHLGRLECAIETARNGKEALAIYASKDLAMILMDCQMPVLDGWETTGLIRRIEATTGRHVPIIAMTAAAMVGDKERCLDVGMDDYLCKPFTESQLQAVIERWIGRQAPEEAMPEITERSAG